MFTGFPFRFSRRVLFGSAFVATGTGIASYGMNRKLQIAAEGEITPAEAQFRTSSLHPVPQGWTGRVWQINSRYPDLSSALDKRVVLPSAKSDFPTLPRPSVPYPGGNEAPWLGVDFLKDPDTYCAVVKEYCFEGNVNNDFVVQNNKIREWYHMVWLHTGPFGREPLNGLTYERPTPPWEFAKTQGRFLQMWAVGFFNAAGAAVLGEVWKDPAKPKWDKDIKFPLGTCIFKVLTTDATNEEIPTINGSPIVKAVIAPQAADPVTTAADPTTRNKQASDMRVIQVDFAVRDDRSLNGWVFGTFMYNGGSKETNPWNRLIPVGLMWGNDPDLNQAAFERGKKPIESWINPEAEKIRQKLGGQRPSWGWNGRLNGPADNFISACSSCHSVSQRLGTQALTQPAPAHIDGRYVPIDDMNTMTWFRNIIAGQPFTPKAISGDYCLQLMVGYHNYQTWRANQSRWKLLVRKHIPGKTYTVPQKGRIADLRSGPDMRYEKPKD